ncbi:MAG TPA: hypothetical protein VMW25_00090 [Clostridia bacterium]|nr:hypothetical protein [Clostridia bacterium]
MSEEIEEVELESTGEIELPKIDVMKYVGRKTIIESVTEHKGKFGYFIKVASETIDTIEGGKEPIKLKASRLFSLFEDKNSKVGWGKDTKLGIFLRKMNVKHYKDLIGKEIVCQTQTNSNGTDFLTFN